MENTLPRYQVVNQIESFYSQFAFVILANSVHNVLDVPDVNLVPYAASMSSLLRSGFEASKCINGVTTGVTSNLCHTAVNGDSAPWLLLKFHNRVAVTRVEIYNRAPFGSRTENLEVRLTEKLPTTGDAMYTGGQLLSTFKGPGTDGQIISVSGSAKIGRYVLIQMKNHQQVLNFHEVFVFGRVSHLETDCLGALDVVSSNQGSRDELVHNLLNLDENEWRADENTGQGFVLRIRGCKRNIIGLRIKNAAQPWSSKGFKVMGALDYSGPWINLVEEELIETNAMLTFHFDQPIEVQFLRFELLSYYSQMEGGLNFFSPIAGSLCVISKST